MPARRLSHDDYRVGWICPLEVEQIAAMEMLDEEHETLPQPRSDTNIYNLGSINNHNVVIAGLPKPGNCSAATVISQMRVAFANLKYGLVVGIGGGVPATTEHGMIRLGHVVVSEQTGIHFGTVQYDHGKARAGHFEHKGCLARPPTAFTKAAREVAVRRQRMDHDPLWKDAQRLQTNPRTRRRFKFPGAASDHLYQPDYEHQEMGLPCEEAGCDPEQRIVRAIDDVEETFVVVHRGTIASGELVIKDSKKRDDLARAHGALCFEMEAAGALTDFPCMIIRGISDYCDSHKNDLWHGYAAAVAAAYARQLFLCMPQEDPPRTGVLDENLRAVSGLPEIMTEHRDIAREQLRAQQQLAHKKMSEDESKCHQLFRLTTSQRDATYEWYKDRVEERVEGTCNWFLEHKTFQAWLGQTSSPLLVSADPGCGKSVLAKYLIDRCLPRTATVCYFFFKDQDQNTVRQALCALLHQLFRKKPSLIEHAMPEFREDGPGLINSTESLWKILRKAARDPRAGPVVVVLDALDECAESEFANLISNVESHFSNQSGYGNLKYLLTSRPYDRVVTKFHRLLEAFPNIRIPGEDSSEAISKEVSRVVAHRVNRFSKEKALAPHVKSHLETLLQETTHRTYLWVYLVFDHLEKEGFKKTTRGVSSAIATLPRSVNDAYEKILAKSKDDPMVRKVLSIILAASRPLTLMETNIAVNLDEGLESIHDLDLESARDFEKRLRNWCGLFVSVHHDKVYFLHQTAREFLLKRPTSAVINGPAPRWHHSIDISCAHSVLARICVAFLGLYSSKSPYRKSSFFTYSAVSWGVHLREANLQGQAVTIPHLWEICDRNSETFLPWITIYWRTTGTNLWPIGIEVPQNLTRLMLASHFGHVDLVKHLIRDGENLDAQDERGRTALSWSAMAGFEAVATLLIEQGADLESKDYCHRTPLSLAAEMGRVSMVKLLSQDSRVDVNSQSGRSYEGRRSPLSYAAENGHEAVADLLIAHKDIKIDLKDCRGKTPLMYAVAAAKSSTAYTLIRGGANVTEFDFERKGLLHHTVINAESELSLVEALITGGAATKSIDAENMTPLHYTVRHGRTDIARALLAHGVPVDIAVHRRTWLRTVTAERHISKPDPLLPQLAFKRGLGLTPLHYAALVGYENMVAFFMQQGADPNAVSAYGETPLHLAVARTLKGPGYTDSWTESTWRVEGLLDVIQLDDEDEYAATTDQILDSRKAVLDTLLGNSRTDVQALDHNAESVLHKIRYGHYRSFELVQKLLERNVVSSSRCCDNQTPLHLACRAGDSYSVCLLASRTDLPKTDFRGRTALHLASCSGSVSTIKAVIGACALHNIDLFSLKDKHLRNALHCYASSLCLDEQGVQLLLDYGVERGETDVDGNLPLSIYRHSLWCVPEINVLRLLSPSSA